MCITTRLAFCKGHSDCSVDWLNVASMYVGGYFGSQIRDGGLDYGGDSGGYMAGEKQVNSEYICEVGLIGFVE